MSVPNFAKVMGGKELSAIFVIKEWKKNSRVHKSVDTITMCLEPQSAPPSRRSISFFLQKNPFPTKILWKNGGHRDRNVETTEWLSLYATLNCGHSPCAFILTVDRLAPDYQFVTNLVPSTHLIINFSSTPELVKANFIPWRRFRHRPSARRFLPPIPGDDDEELLLHFKVVPLLLNPSVPTSEFVQVIWTFMPEHDTFVDLILESEDCVQLSCHKFIVAARCPYLKELISKGINQGIDQMKIKVYGVNAVPLSLIVTWMYTGALRMEDLESGCCSPDELARAADLLQLPALISLLRREMGQHLPDLESTPLLTAEGESGPEDGQGGTGQGQQGRKRVIPMSSKKKKKKGDVRPFRSLGCLGLDNPLRKICYAITESNVFQHFIFVIILATCYTLAFTTPYPNNDTDEFNLKVEETEIYFTVIFTAECFMSIIAQGLISHEGAYLRGGVWNILDFVVVMVGLAAPVLSSFIPNLNLKALRAFRVLRPLKLASKVPALHVVINSIMMAMIPLFNIAILVLFVMALYAIIGLQMFEGQLHRTCFHNSTGEMMRDPCNCGGLYNCEDQEDGEFWECREYWPGPNDGITNFDNIGLAMLTVYQCLSMEGWTDVMYNLQDAQGAHWEWIYFVSMVFFGAFFTMNLVLGVLSGEFGKQKEKVDTRFHYLKQREKKMLDESMDAYLKWIHGGIYGQRRDTLEDLVEGEAQSKLKVYWNSFKRANKPARKLVRKIINSQLFYWTIIILVLLNTLILATEHYLQPMWLQVFQEEANFVLIVLFTTEMSLKIYSLGCSKYFRSLFNRFDFFATTVSLVELSLVQVNVMPQLCLSVLRCVRLLRLFKFTHYWPAMKSLMAGIIGSIQSVVSLLVLLFLFVMIFSMLGMQVFGGSFSVVDPSTEKPRNNYDSFGVSMLTVFQILTGEDWNEVMYLGINAQGGVSSAPTGVIIAVIYFTILFTLGNYILLNVFLAIAVDNLEPAEPEKEEEEEAPAAAAQGGEKEGGAGGGDAASAAASANPGENEEKAEKEQLLPQSEKAGGEEGVEGEGEGGAKSDGPDGDPLCPPIPEGYSFFILSQKNPIRVICHRVLSNTVISNFLLISILISSGCLAAEDPVYEDSPRNKMLEKIDYGFTVIFTIELILKLLIYGLIFHQGSFCRSIANILDLVVVGVSLLSIFSTSDAVASMKTLKVIRVLRPLRALNRAPGLKRVIQCMVVSIKTVGNVVMVTTFLEFIYAVVGVQLFKGGLFRCTDTSKKTQEECHGDFFIYEDGKPVIVERIWENSPFNFDNVANGMLTLFAVSTFEGWPQMLFKCIDSNGEGAGPVHNNRMIMAFFYISYLIVISFYMINIFVGFVILTFQTEGEKEFEEINLDKNQRDCMEFALKAKPVSRYVPTNPFQKRIWYVVVSSTFDNISLSLVILNTISLGANFYRQPDWWTETLALINLFFTAAFTVELVIKLLAFGIRIYLKDAWNVFDLLIVLGSYVDLAFADVNISFLRLFRAGRLVKLLNKSDSLRTILWTFIKSLKALPYVILLILLVFFIYAIVGMQTFGKIALDTDTQIHRNNNFQNFGNTLLVLFRCATGEAWQDVMMSCINAPHVECFREEDGEQCGSDAAYPYFVSFFVICAFLVLNLLVAVIMDNFDYLTRDSSILGAHHLAEFVQKWTDYDLEATGYIRHEKFISLLRSIWPPLGFGMLCPKLTACKQLIAMNMPLEPNGTVQFNAALFALVRIRLQIRMEGMAKASNVELREIIHSLWKDIDPDILEKALPLPKFLDEENTVGKFYACLLIQRKYRVFQQRKLKAAQRRKRAADESSLYLNMQNVFSHQAGTVSNMDGAAIIM